MQSTKHLSIGLLVAAACCLTSPASHAATPLACDPDNAGLTLPEGFCALVAADELGTARHAVVAPNGDLYVALQSGKGKTGGVVALRDENGDGRFETKEFFGDGKQHRHRAAQWLFVRGESRVGGALGDDSRTTEACGPARGDSRGSAYRT